MNAKPQPDLVQEIARNHFPLDGKNTCFDVRLLAALREMAQRCAEQWTDAIQGAIGDMGRAGDRDYFTFCMFLVFRQAEKDGLIPTETRTEQRLEKMRPKIAAMQATLYAAAPLGKGDADKP